ncbi:ZrgA family zinc uptake protein, partial [Marinobacter xestospongiae]
DEEPGSVHRDVEVSQQIVCEGQVADVRLESTLFQRFPNLESLRVEWVTDQAQGSHRLSLDQPGFELP